VYLAVEGQGAQRRDTLLGLLWPDVRDSAARNSLRVALANLRQTLGDAAPSADRQMVQLRLDSGALDVASYASCWKPAARIATTRTTPAPPAPRDWRRRSRCIAAIF